MLLLCRYFGVAHKERPCLSNQLQQRLEGASKPTSLQT